MTTKHDICLPTSAHWMTEGDICQQFAVGSLRLHEYSNRGDLPCRFGTSGEVLYDARTVEGLFRKRSAQLTPPQEQTFGRLGKLQLGNASPSEWVKPRRKVVSITERRTFAA